MNRKLQLKKKQQSLFLILKFLSNFLLDTKRNKPSLCGHCLSPAGAVLLEIDNKYYPLIENAVSHKYLIEFDEETSLSSISKGYFKEVINK